MKRRQRRAQRETSAGGVVFRRPPDSEPRFLLIRDSYRNWGFPKGHLEPGEPPADAARREVAEETGLNDLVLHGPIRVIDWYFRFRGKTIHKFCRSEEHTSELQSLAYLVCRLLLEKKKKKTLIMIS